MKMDAVVVGFDGSSNAELALDAAAEIVAPGGTVHVVTAFHAPAQHEVAEVIAALPDEFKHTYDLLATPRGHLRTAELHLEGRGVDHKGHFVEDDPASAILDVADVVDADLIVVGSRGLGRGTRFLRGSVSSRVAGHADRSFLIVRDGD